MSLMRENDPRFANLERKVGVFLLACLLAAAAAIFAAASRQGLFTPKATISFVDESGRDLAAGMEIVTRGFHIGSVSSVRLNDAGLVEVRLAIDRSYLRWVRRDSTARMLPKMIGGGRIEVSAGSPGAPAMEDGDVIAFERDPELIDVAKRIMEDVKPVLFSVRSLIEYLDDPEGDVKASIANVKRLTAGLEETRSGVDRTVAEISGRLTALAGSLERMTASVEERLLPQVEGVIRRGDGVLAAADGTVRELDAFLREDVRGLAATIRDDLVPQVQDLVAAAGAGAETAGRAATTVDARLPALLEQVETSLANVQRITNDLVPVSAQAGGVLAKGQALMDDSGVLIRRTQELWPFRGGAPVPERKIDVDSYRAAPPASGGRAPGDRGGR